MEQIKFKFMAIVLRLLVTIAEGHKLEVGQEAQALNLADECEAMSQGKIPYGPSIPN